MTSRRRCWPAAALAVLVVLAGCTEAPAVTRSSGPASAGTGTAAGPGSPAPDSPAPDSSGLAAAKRAAGIADCPTSEADVAPVSSGLPDVVLPCLGGGRAVRLAGLRGRPMIVNVWASWCAPCRTEAPFLADVASTTRSDVEVLGVNHADHDPAGAITFAQVAAWTYPQLQDRDEVLRRELGVVGLPVTFFVRADGTIAYRNLTPFTSADQVRELSRRYLGVTP